jgi:hypothetical protein
VTNDDAVQVLAAVHHGGTAQGVSAVTLEPLKFGDKIVYDAGTVASVHTRLSRLVEKAVQIGAIDEAQVLADAAAILACVVREMGASIKA